MVKIKDISNNAAQKIYTLFREKPSGFFSYKTLFDELKSESEDLNENDFLVAMSYLEQKRLITTEKFIGSEMSWIFKPTANLIDYIEE